MADAWDQFPDAPANAGGGSHDVWDQFPDAQEKTPEVSAEDLMVPRPTGSDAFKDQQAAIRKNNGVLIEPDDGPRVGDSLKPLFGGHNPVAETYDTFISPFTPAPPRSTDEVAYRERRSVPGFVKGVASTITDLPFRAATGGEYGAGDALRAIGLQSAGDAVSGASREFAETYPEQMNALAAAGDLSLGTAGVAAARVPSAKAQVTREFRPDLPASRAAAAAEDAQAFDRLNVRPFGPAFQQGPMASVAKQLSETPIVGAPLKNALDESLRGTAKAADTIREGIGDASDIRQAGVTAQQGLERFKDARPAEVVGDRIAGMSDQQLSDIIAAPTASTSLKTKQAALYERAWRNIPEDMRQGRAVEGQARMMSNPANTRAVINDIVDRNMRMINQSQAAASGGDNVASPVRGGLLGRMVDALRNPRWSANLQTLRDIRSEFRRLASGMPDTEKNVLSHSDLSRIQSAVTQDMIAQLQRNADAASMRQDHVAAGRFTRAISQFRQADQFTRLSMQRMENVERLFNASSVESLAQNIQRAALGRGKGNLDMLRSLQRTLRPEEMGDVSSAVLSELGRPVASARGVAQELGFSVNSFITRWEQMSPEAKQILFRGEHGKALDDLVKVANRLSNVESLANTSRSGTNALNLGGILAGGGAIATGHGLSVLGSLAAGFGASLILSRPSYVQWAVKYAQLRGRALSGSSAAIKPLHVQIRNLARLAKADPQLIPVVIAAAHDNGMDVDPGKARRLH